MNVYLLGGLALHESYLDGFKRELDELGLNVEILAFDRSHPTSEYITDLTERIESPAVLVGHSFGCQIAEEICRAQPDRCKGLLLFGPAMMSRSSLGLLTRLAADGLTREPLSLAARGIWDFVIRTGPRRLMSEARLSKRLWKGRGGSLGIPTWVIHAAGDLMTEVSCSISIAGRLEAELRILMAEDAAHGMVYTHPDACALVVDEFVRSLD